MEEQIIEIFGKRVKIVESDMLSKCLNCAFYYIDESYLCRDANGKANRYFVEVDEDGNEINNN